MEGWTSLRLPGSAAIMICWSTLLFASLLVVQPQDVLVLHLPCDAAPFAAFGVLDVSVPFHIALRAPSWASIAPNAMVRSFQCRGPLFHKFRLGFVDCCKKCHRLPGGLRQRDGNERSRQGEHVGYDILREKVLRGVVSKWSVARARSAPNVVDMFKRSNALVREVLHRCHGE
jgi:hypothetical protein